MSMCAGVIDKAAKYLTGFGRLEARKQPGHHSVQPCGYFRQSHIKIDLNAYCRTQRIQ
jgi:hypothetical protein